MTAPVNILLVDDQPRNLDVLEAVLSSPGYRLVRADSANAALLALLDEEFAAIVLDIKMPGMSGPELAQIIKQRERTRHIPILFLTAHTQDEADVLLAYDAGGVDYLNKPINPQVLRSKINVFADLFRKRGITHCHVHFANRAAHTGLFIKAISGIPISISTHGQDFMVDLGNHDLRREMCREAVLGDRGQLCQAG